MKTTPIIKNKNPLMTEFDRLCIKFFLEIDPSLKWLKIYNQLKQEERIEYIKQFSHPTSQSDSNDDISHNSESIKDFPNFINGFTNYIVFSNNDVESISSSDILYFPAAFFEMYAKYFLKKEGYEKEISAHTSPKSDTFTTKILEKVQENPYLMYTMLEITENFSQETKESISQKLGIRIISKNSKKEPNPQYKK